MNSISDILDNTTDDSNQEDTTPATTVPIVNPSTDDFGIEETTETLFDDVDDKTAEKNNDLDIAQLKNQIHAMKDQLESMLRLLDGKKVENFKQANPDTDILHTGERIVEGVFNGEKMVGADGKEYLVPANYASKSKLVEGDMMKLTITNAGKFLYKQIGPIERKSLIGEIVSDGEQYSVTVDGHTYKVLTASVTFFKGKAGDEAVILVPQDGQSEWAAVDNIITTS